jgi:glyoxylase-like metal-dependent hydrolase (beta-lactamase superfamily II)
VGTPGAHCAFFDAASGALFTGDAGRGALSSDGRSVFAPLYLDVADARQSLRRLLDISFSLLCPAHFAPMSREEGIAFLKTSIEFVDEADAMARDLVNEGGSYMATRELALRLGETVGANPPVSPQTVAAARAHLYALGRAGLLEAAWAPRGR